MSAIQFGWNPGPSPLDHHDGRRFVDDILSNLNAIHTYYDSCWLVDHLIAPRSFPSPDLPRLECWTTLSYLAHAYPDLDFGSNVLAQSYRNPALLAKMGATLQLLTGGRFILGIGAGWYEEEYRMYGYEFPKASVRIGQLAEAVQIIRQLWTEKRATFTGEYYQIHDAICEPKPDPLPPIMIGGMGEKLTLRAVARYADWWNSVVVTADELSRKMDILRSHCQAVGRDYDEIGKTYSGIISIAETEAKARQIAEASPHNSRYGLHLVGTSEQIAEYLKAYIDLGIEYFILQFADFPSASGALQFAEEIMPAIR